MGGEETEIGDETTTVLLEAANFEPHGIYRSSERQRLRTEGSNRWEKGVDPYLAEPAADLATRLMLELAGGRWTAHSDVHAGLPLPPVVHFRPERADALIGIETPARASSTRCSAGSASSATRRERRRPDLARARRHARGRRDRGDRALPARGRARHAAGAARDVRPAHARAAAAPPRRGRARRPRLRRDLHAEPRARTTTRPWKLPEPISVELTALRTTLIPSLVEAVRRNVDAGARRIALFEIARVYLAGGELPNERVRVAGHRRGRLPAGEGRRRDAATRRSRPSRRSSAPRTRCSIRARRRARTPASSASSTRACSRGRGARSSSTSRTLFAASHEPVTYEDVITYPAVRQDIAFAVPEEVAGRRSRRGGAGGGRPGAARDPRVRRLPRRAARPGPQVGRVLGRLPVERGHALRGARDAACATASSPRSPSSSAPSCGRSRARRQSCSA